MKVSVSRYLSAFEWIGGILTGIGVAIPALSFFTLYAPPFFKAASLFTAAIATAVVILTYYYNPKLRPGETEAAKLVTLARRALVVAVVLLIVYMLMLKVCTVVDPPNNPEARYQIGFWNFDWSLNEQDGMYLKRKHPTATPYELMAYDAALNEDGSAKVWKFWTIILAGTSMIVVFLFAFVLWVLSWSLLARRRALSEAGETEAGEESIESEPSPPDAK